MKIIYTLNILILAAWISVTQAQATTYTYDDLNRLKTVTYDSGQTVEYNYDAAGNILTTLSSVQDTDGDGVIDSLDTFPNDPNEWEDTDGDSTGNNADLDDDNDLIPDLYETANGLDPLDSTDALIDTDADNYSNLEEYLAGSNLNDSSSLPSPDAPIISPDVNTLYSRAAVSLSLQRNDAAIYYTTDGSEPNNTSTLYTGAFLLETNATVKAVAIRGNAQTGSVANQNYTVLQQPVWKPAKGTTWQWQLQGVIDTSHDVSAYNIDLFDTPQETIDQLKADDRQVICYFNAGVWVDGRSDAGQFQEIVKGNLLDGSTNNKWLDIRELETLAPIMQARLDLAVSKGCDAIDPDKVDGYKNNTGFELTAEDQLAYHLWLSNQANARGLSIGLKNNLELIAGLEPFFDWALNEQCFELNQCDALQAFITANKAVFGVEYVTDTHTPEAETICPLAIANEYSWIIKKPELGSFLQSCAVSNDLPVAVNDSYTMSEDTTLMIDAANGVLANDSDPELDLLQAILVDEASNGILNLYADGSFDYTPVTSFTGTDNFTYHAFDGLSNSNLATVNLMVNGVNILPIALADAYSLIENNTLTVDATTGILANDSDADPLQAVLVNDVSNGVLVLNSDGSFNYTPNADFVGVDSFTYQANDDTDNSNEVTVTLTVEEQAVIDDPDVIAPVITLNGSPSINLFVDDAYIELGATATDDLDGDISSQIVIDATAVNTAVAGTYTVTYNVSDTAGNTAVEVVRTVIVDTDPVIPNEAPVANDDTVDLVQIGSTISFTVTENDADSDGNLVPSSVLINSNPSEGVAAVASDGTITYVHTGSTATTDSLSYTVQDTENAVSNVATVSIIVIDPTVPNVVPVATNDEASVQAGEAVIIPVLANDSDSDGSLNKDNLTVVNGATYGSVDIDFASGKITYTHDGSDSNTDTFTYTVEDDEGETSNIATVSITITSSSASCGKGIELDGINDLINIPDLVLRGDFTLEGWVKLAEGIDHKDGLLGDGIYTYFSFSSGKPRLNAYGVRITATTAISSDTWAHIAVSRSGSNLTMYVNGVEDATGNYGGSLSIKFLGKGYRGFFKGMMDEVRIWDIERSGTEIIDSYNTSVDPNAPGLIGYWNFNGTDQMITDISSSSNHGSLGINTDSGIDDPVRLDLIDPPTEHCDGDNTNVAPLASDDTIGPVEAGATISFSVTGNDTDSDGNLNPSSVVIVSEPNDGTALVDASGVITYMSTGTTATTDTLSYTVADTEGVISNIATVSITISDPATNETPVAQADTATVQNGDSVLITVLSNDSDNDGSLNTNSLTIVNQPNYGIIDIDGAGEITYTHNGSAMTTDSFTYTVEDDEGAVSNEATVSITISSLSASCGRGIELDGINDLINIPDLVLRGDFTLEGWVKLAAGIDHKDGLLGDGVLYPLKLCCRQTKT